MLYFFFLYWSHSSSLCTVFDSISSNMDEVFLNNPSASVFVFGNFNIHHKDWVTYSGGSNRPGEFCYNFSLSNDLTQMVNCLTQILAVVNILTKNPYFFPTPQILKPLFLPCFLYFRKICSRHQCHHFHLRFCQVWSIGWGEIIFCQKFGKRGVKH